MSFNGCYQNNSHKEIKKATRSFQLQFLLISALILPYFHYFFASGNTPKGQMSLKIVSNKIFGDFGTLHALKCILESPYIRKKTIFNGDFDLI